MHTPTPAQLLQVWERGGNASAAARGLLLLGCCSHERPAGELAALPLGRRDALLLELHERLFGATIDVVASCPQCAATVEATFRCEDLRLAVPDSDTPALACDLPGQGRRAHFRLPDSSDLIALEQCGDAGAAHALLLERCVLAAESDGTQRDVHALPADLQAGIAQAMAQADPQADLQLAFRCPDCGHAWQPLFDVARFLWQELHAWALRLLREVDTLAQAYHWGEAEILALSPRRRQAYLELCAP
jgi:hypothetical protein